MPFPKSWDSKPKIATLPFRVNDIVMCFNCNGGYPKEEMNPSTGLCRRCVYENQPPWVIPDPVVEETLGPRCSKCKVRPLRNMNIGICRDMCEYCMRTDHPLKQRCMSCNNYRKDCFNGMCSSCTSDLLLCESVGHFFLNENHHFKTCWCLDFHKQTLRKDCGIVACSPYTTGRRVDPFRALEQSLEQTTDTDSD